MPPKKNNGADFSESDRARLEALLEDAEFERRLAERNKARREAVRVWTQWLSIAVALLAFGREALVWAASHIKAWLA